MNKTAFIIALTVLASITVVNGQSSSPSAPVKRTDVYSVTFIHAAPGKASALEEAGRKATGTGPTAGHALILRHECGSPWDYVTISHEGAKATVDPAGNPAGVVLRPLMDWHDDTFVNGPSWSEFAKAMDLDEKTGKPKSNQAVYVISVYRPVLGQDDALEKNLSEPPAAGDLTAGSVLLQHLEGGAWRFLTIVRYKNYQDYGTSEAKSVADIPKGNSPWHKLRDVCSFHNDTIGIAVGP